MNPRLSAPLACAMLLAIACGTGCPGPTPAQPSSGATGGGNGTVKAPGSSNNTSQASTNPGSGPIVPTKAPTAAPSAAPSAVGPSAAPSGTPGPTAEPTASPTATPSAGPTATTFLYFAADLPIAQNAGAGGGAIAKLADDGKTLALRAHIAGATGDLTGAHVRQGPANQAGTSVHDMAVDADKRSVTGSWTATSAAPLTAERLQQLKTGGLFMALDTLQNPNGEARGTLIGFAQAFAATLEPPAGVSAPSAKGAAWAGLDGATKLTIKLYTGGLTGPLTGVHVHAGGVGETGAIVKDLELGADKKTATATWGTTDAAQPLTQALLDALKTGKLYLVGHTPQNPAGEIRGQLLLP